MTDSVSIVQLCCAVSFWKVSREEEAHLRDVLFSEKPDLKMPTLSPRKIIWDFPNREYICFQLQKMKFLTLRIMLATVLHIQLFLPLHSSSALSIAG